MLTFNVKKIWFDKIKSGEKTHEYRVQNKYWIARIKNFIGWRVTKDLLDRALNEGGYFHYYVTEVTPYPRAICFCCGYPKKGDREKHLYGLVTKISANIDGRNTDLEINEPVFDIEFELINMEEK